MNTENIKSIFKDYLIIENTNYALLLNGNWGSGKSFFWRNSLTKIVEQNGYNYIYISLNGISKIETLEHVLFLKLLPIIGKKEDGLLKNTTTLVTNVLNKVSTHYLKTSISDIFKGVSIDAFNFSKYIICFDDLERSQIPIKEVLGFINNYVEHKNLKTIILADENQINNPDDKTYDNIKEKLIGRTLNFKLEIKETLPELLKNYNTNNSKYYTFLTTYEDYIKDILIEYKQQNLRTISFCLEILAKIYPIILEENEKFIKEMILFSIIITIEFKNGKITSKDFDKFEEFAGYNRFTLITESIMRSAKKNELNSEKIKTKKDEFKETYLGKRLGEYHFYPSIYSFILSGYLNEENLKEQLVSKNKSEFGTPESTAYTKLVNYNFRMLSDNDFEKLYIEVKDFAEKGSYSLYEYSHIANIYYYFEKNKLVNLTTQEITDFILTGLLESAKQKQIDQNEFDNLFHFKEENTLVEDIKETIRKLHNDIKKEQDIEKSNILIECIKNNNLNLIRELFDKFNYSSELFLYINSQLLFQEIIKTENLMIESFIRLIHTRYKSTNIGEYLYDDINVLNDLKERLESYLVENKITKPLRRFIVNNLIEELNIVCEHLEKTKK
jgi:hypothetical protein